MLSVVCIDSDTISTYIGSYIVHTGHPTVVSYPCDISSEAHKYSLAAYTNIQTHSIDTKGAMRSRFIC